tara:strand:- start:206 stop:460 length:255 start_codon:yes stop_codon:yes gene_type:complete
MTSKWEDYKEKLGDARPWDLVNPKTEYVSKDVAQERYDICKACPQLIKATKQCKECGCFMKVKTTLAHAECPLHKWGKASQETD